MVALPFALLGIWLGQHQYTRLDEARLRQLIWCLLALPSLLGTAAALARLVAG